MSQKNTISQPTGDSLVTVKEVCKIMTIGKTFAWELIKLKQLEVVYLSSRCTRVKRSSIDRIISMGRT